MADQKLTQLTEMTTPSDDDLMYMVDNPGGTPASRKITWANIKANAPSAKLSALDALTWVANSIILLTGAATASVQALAAHIVTLLQSADAAGARTSIGAETAGAAATVQTNLNTHAALSTTAHGGILPEDAGIVTVSSGRDIATTDRGKVLEVTATAALNCPNGISGALQCAIASIGGTTTITATGTLQYLDGGVQTAATLTVNTSCTLYHRGSNVWMALGDVSA